MSGAYLFVYGTLRIGCDAPLAHWLRAVARHVGSATAKGALYRVGYYPGFVPDGLGPGGTGPGETGDVTGDLFVLPDMVALWARLDAYEECTADHPPPHEYRRQQIVVMAADGPVTAWTYVYAFDVSGLDRIESGDFLAG